MYSKVVLLTFVFYFKAFMSYKAIIIGASGLIGSELVKQVSTSDEFNEIVFLTRRQLDIYNHKIRQIVVNFDHLADVEKEIAGDVIFSCLGSTRSKTPDAKEYRKIEYDYTIQIAEIGLKNKVRQFHYISSLGADASSSNSYLKLKGEVEERLKQLPFEALHIYQPSYLTGDREEKRIDDKIMQPLMRIIDPILFGNLRKYRSIPAGTVAKAMLNQSLKNQKGTFIYPSNIIKQLA